MVRYIWKSFLLLAYLIRQRGTQAVLPTLLTHSKPSAKQMIRAFFGDRFVGKEDDFRTNKLSSQQLED
jgi:hypothetical protein